MGGGRTKERARRARARARALTEQRRGGARARGSSRAGAAPSAHVLLGSFFLLNVTLAIVWDAFTDINDHEEKQQKKVRVPSLRNAQACPCSWSFLVS